MWARTLRRRLISLELIHSTPATLFNQLTKLLSNKYSFFDNAKSFFLLKFLIIEEWEWSNHHMFPFYVTRVVWIPVFFLVIWFTLRAYMRTGLDCVLICVYIFSRWQAKWRFYITWWTCWTLCELVFFLQACLPSLFHPFQYIAWLVLVSFVRGPFFGVRTWIQGYLRFKSFLQTLCKLRN